MHNSLHFVIVLPMLRVKWVGWGEYVVLVGAGLDDWVSGDEAQVLDVVITELGASGVCPDQVEELVIEASALGVAPIGEEELGGEVLLVDSNHVDHWNEEVWESSENLLGELAGDALRRGTVAIVKKGVGPVHNAPVHDSAVEAEDIIGVVLNEVAIPDPE